MCGISAVVSLRGGDGQRHHTNADPHSCNETLNEELTQKMHSSLDMIIHRGPDSRGIWTSHDGKVGPLVHTCQDRLQSIIPADMALIQSLVTADYPSTT